MKRHRCLFCEKPMGRGIDDLGFPVVRVAAYDTEKGRLWAVCDRCRRWNLWPLEERSEIIEGLERLAYDRGVAVARTENIALLRAADLGLVRVGAAGLAERSWWRYGRELERRRAWSEGNVARLSGLVHGALAVVGNSVGLSEIDQKVRWDRSGLTDVHRWRKFGWAAWRGRMGCPNCGSVRRALLYNTTWSVHPVATPDGFDLVIPCPRCDFWDPKTSYRLKGEMAETTLRRILAYQHIEGASAEVVDAASTAIERAGTLQGFIEQVCHESASLWRMNPVHAVGLEIAVNESAERRVLRHLAREYDFVWRREEELAEITDGELT